MKLRLLVANDNEILFEIPLFLEDWPKEHLAQELASFEREFDQFPRLLDVLSHQTRLRMMTRLFEDEDARKNRVSGCVHAN